MMPDRNSNVVPVLKTTKCSITSMFAARGFEGRHTVTEVFDRRLAGFSVSSVGYIAS